MPTVPPGSEVSTAIEALGKLAAETNRVSSIALTALRTSESRYRRLFETAQDGILLLNAESAHIEDVNPFLMKMLNYSKGEFLSKNSGKSARLPISPQAKSCSSNCRPTTTCVMKTCR